MCGGEIFSSIVFRLWRKRNASPSKKKKVKMSDESTETFLKGDGLGQLSHFVQESGLLSLLLLKTSLSIYLSTLYWASYFPHYTYAGINTC